MLFICGFLIYSMSLTDIESKVTELSILRILGMEKLNVIVILFMKGVYFSIPAFFIGLSIVYAFRGYMSGLVDKFIRF